MEEVKMNWLSDQNGNLLAPKTLIEAVQNAEGTSLEELLNSSSGLPEVYIGNEEPTEEGIEIFIDTSENAEEHYTVAFADTPIGTIISYMGNTAPKDYLICDGTEYEIVKYKDLAEHIKTEFGSYNYFGGDGTTTFAVPDLRGEFLRGSGENSHSKQGSGTNVGEHQDATKHIYTEENQNDDWCWFKGATRVVPENYDSTYSQLNIKGQYIDGLIWTSSIQGTTFYTSRPTNTSVLYCIKYKVDKKSANIIPQHEYSTEEKVVGKWIDGKPIYEKTFEIGTKSSNYTFTIENLDKIINYTGNCIVSSYNRPIPYNQIQYSNFIIINDYKDGVVNLATNLTYTDCVLVIQYTKTTD